MSGSSAEKLCRLSSTDSPVIAVAGCSKNAGKTTAMNVLTATWRERRVGLLSIGIDGEDADFWLGVPKPRIAAAAGTVFATAERTLHAASCPVDVVERTGISTPLGEMVIGRTLDHGLLLLAGIRHKADVRAIRDRMKALGTERIVIDGAYQRLMSADPDISDGLVLATGAILGSTTGEVVEKTAWFVDRIRLPAASDAATRELLTEACDLGRGTVLGDGLVTGADGAGIPPVLEAAARCGAGLSAVALPGAVPAGFLDMLDDLAARFGCGQITLAVQDATRVFAGNIEFRRFLRHGHSMVVGRAIRLLAIAVNPVSVVGGTIPSAELVGTIEALIPDVPVIDFVAAANEAAAIL